MSLDASNKSREASNRSRGAILRRVQKALNRDAQSPATLKIDALNESVLSDSFERLAQAKTAANPVGVPENPSSSQLMSLFIERATKSNTVVDVFEDMNAVVAWVERKVDGRADKNIPIFCQTCRTLNTLDWSTMSGSLTENYTLANRWSLVQADCAVAETGSVAFVSGKEYATASGFLADNLMVVLRQASLVAGIEDIWPLIDAQRASSNHKTHPRAITMMTGPSRTADVEQTVQLGAHGPRALYVALIKS